MPTDADSSTRTSTRTTSLLLVVGAMLLAALLWLFRDHLHLDWRALGGQYRTVSWPRVALGIVLIYLCFVLRAARWSVLLAPVRRCSTWQLLPAQLIGFTGVALLGRVADLARPYLIARRTQTPVATQIAIYSIERAFDLAAAATLFSTALAFAPASMPHHQAFARAGILSLLATLLLAALAVSIRIAGRRLATVVSGVLRPLAPRLAEAAAARVLDLQRGFGAISSFAEFAAALALSLLMWIGIAACYLLGATAFRASPQLAAFSLSATMLILATGIGGGILQLPILGWFTQVALFATTLHTLFAVPVETATACAALIFAITNLAVIPTGLLAAYTQGITLRDLTRTDPEVPT